MPKQARKGNCFICGKHNCPLCPNCQNVHTCKLHFRCHNQNDYCFPFRIQLQPDGSHRIVASRDIQALELILFEKALAVGPRTHDGDEKVCPECFRKVNGLKVCGLCGLYICGDECQVGHNHYIECPILCQTRDTVKSQVLKLKAVMAIRIMGANNRNEVGYTRARLFHQGAVAVEIDAAVTKFVTTFTTAEEDEVKWALMVARTKTVETSDGRGLAFFPLFSLTRHACASNSKYLVYANYNVAMQAQKPIMTGDEITVSYVHALEPTWKRRGILYRNRLEMCECNRCRDPTEFGSLLSALKCQKCQDIAPLLPESPLDPKCFWSCQIHKSIRIPASQAQQLAIDLQVDLYSGGLLTTIRKLETKIEDISQFLHPQHGLLMAAKRSLVNCYSQVSSDRAGRRHQEQMRDLCNEQIQVLERVDSGYPDWKGDVLKHMSTALLNLARMDLQDGLIERPEFLTKVREAMQLVREGVRCKSCVKVERSTSRTMTLDEMVDNMSDSEAGSSLSSSRNSSVHSSTIDLR